MIIYKTKSLADSYECSACGTVFTLADLERTCQHPGLGKYTVAPTLDRCPFCDAECNYKTARIVRRDPPVERNKEIAGLLKRKYQLEMKIEQANAKRIEAEGAGLIDNGAASFEAIIAADTAGLASRSNAQNVVFESLLDLNEIDDEIDSVSENAVQPKHLPRTKTQDCISGGVTIKPQVDWEMVDRLIADHGLPLPVEIVEKYM